MITKRSELSFFLDLGKENNEVDRFLVNLDVRIVVIYVRKVIPISE